MGYIARHWRGELSLPLSFWVNNGLLMLPLGLGIGFLMVWIAVWGQSLQAASVALLVGAALLLLLSVWGTVGAWRAANTYLDEGGTPGWGMAAKLLLFVGTLLNLGTMGADLLPQLPMHLRQVLGQDPIGRLEMRLAADGRTVTLSGPFGMGAAPRFQRLLQTAPQLRQVLLDSPGGRLFEAHEIAQQVKARGLSTRASADCASACTLVFVAGTQRSLAPGARLGFHRASVPSLNPLHDQLANLKLASLYDEAGLPRDFIVRVLAVPAQRMWFPVAEQLINAGILPRPRLLPELPPPLPADTPLASYRELLGENLLWLALEQRQAGAIDDAAQRMQQARQRGLELDAVAQEAQSAALAAVPTVLRSAGAGALDRYLALLSAELRERRSEGDAACQALLGSAGGLESPRWVDWMQTALLEPADPQPARALTGFKEAIYKPYGMLLITGPTGSGKTTTLYSALSELNKPDVNISTAEDPVEYNLMGINQVQVRDEIGLNF
ncbi:MAG: ATPase, T2SS/T4P/T4SS family, partial [Rubrivivax sp.]